MRSYTLIHDIFSPAFGKPCWNLVGGVFGTHISMEFGNPALDIRRPTKSDHVDGDPAKPIARRRVSVKGEYTLVIWSCAWTFHHLGTLVGHSNLKGSSKTPIKKAMATLHGQMLTAVAVEPHTGRSEFRFDLGGHLLTEPYEPDTDQWQFSTPSGKYLVYRSDGKYSFQPGNTSPSDQQWQVFSGRE
jgi:hypothetical protein